MKEVVHKSGRRDLTSTEHSEERRLVWFVLTVVILRYASFTTHGAYIDWSYSHTWHHWGNTIVGWLRFVLFILLRIFVSGADTSDSVRMLCVCSIDSDGNVSWWRVGRELARCDRGHLPLLRTISNKSRRGRYHVIALCLRPSPIIPVFASVYIPFLRSRCRYLTLMLALCDIMNGYLFFEGKNIRLMLPILSHLKSIICEKFSCYREIGHQPFRRFQSKTPSSTSPLFLRTLVNNSRRKS